MRTIAVLLCAILASPPQSAVASELAGGVSRADLTPPLEWRVALGGYGARMSRPATGVHDRIFAKALVLSDGEQKFALVTADVLALPHPFKPAVLDCLGGDWSSEQLMLLPSHSHTSLDMSSLNPANTFDVPQIGLFHPRLFEFALDNVVRAIREAEHNLRPVAVGTETMHVSGWNRNRRSADGIVDDELILTRIDGVDGTPLAVLVNLTAHPTFMTEREMMFSAGWPGHLQRTLEALVGESVTVMYYNGAEGDQSPVARPDSGDSRWERAERYGRELALLAWNEWQDVDTVRDVAFTCHEQPISLPERTWHPDFLKTGGAEYGLSEDLLRKMLPALFPQQTSSVSVRIGDLVIAGVPGEMAAGLGLQIKAAARNLPGVQHVAIGGLANEWVSYILSSEEYERGGYEASVSFYGPNLGPVVVEGVVAGVHELVRSP